MIGSITEARDQLRALEQRRQEIAEQNTAHQAAAAAPVAVPAGVMPAGALDQGRGYLDAMDDEAAGKSFRDCGISEGPASSPEPGRIAAAEFDRPYLSAGHGAEAPASGPPRENPIMHAGQGIVQPIRLPGAPAVGYVPSSVTASVSMGSPSERAR